MYSSLLWALACGAVVASYYMQKNLPPPKPAVLGIDLGTTYSCVGVFHIGSGRVQVLSQGKGKRVIPSVVAFPASGGVLVGEDAKRQAAINPLNTIYEAKRYMGRSFEQVRRLQDTANRLPFKVVDVDNQPRFEVVMDGRRTLKSPEEIGAHVLGRLRLVAESTLGIQLSKVVMAVPAEFDARQRNATVEAAAQAGLEVVRLLSEPTAAAMAYGLHNKHNVNVVVVFDFGGGTLDVSVLAVQGSMFATVAIAGNSKLGGEDFSHVVFEHLLAVYEERTGHRCTNVSTLQRLRIAAEGAKLDLSSEEEVTVQLPTDPESGNRPAPYLMSRGKFEEVCDKLFAKVLVPLQRALHKAGMEVDEVDEVVLVGGSTRMPRVRALLTELVGKAPNHDINPDEAVAVGVAIQGGIFSGAWPLPVAAIEFPFDDEKIDVAAEDG